MITWYRFPEILGAVRIFRLRRLLRGIASATEIMVKNSWCDFVTDNGFHCRPADVNLSSAAVGSTIDGFGTNLRLKNWRHRLSLVFQTTFDPAELRGIEGRHLDHRDSYVAFVVDQFAAQRISETGNSVFRGAVSRL